MKKYLNKEIDIFGAKTSILELTTETIINFCWGFVGNSIVVFMAKELDVAVFINFFMYYLLISYVVNREKYKTRLGKFVVLPVSASLGAFTGYKVAQLISNLL
jgi:hypothetical protein